MRELERGQRMALRIRNALLSHRRWTMRLESCDPLGVDLGIDQEGARRFLLEHPQTFEVTARNEVTFARRAFDLVSRERHIPLEPYVVFVLRKLLMLSKRETIHASKLMNNRCFEFPHLRQIFTHNPMFFHCDSPRLQYARLRLVSWDPELAVTARERTLALLERSLRNGSGEELRMLPLESGAGMATVRSPEELLRTYRQPTVSPFDRSSFSPANRMLERQRKIGVVHEFLSLARDKRAEIADLDDLYRELELDQGQDLENFLRAEKEMFTVEVVHGKTMVFLNEGYDWNHTQEPNPFWDARRRFLDLLASSDEHSLEI